jgi:hypothetical protein
MPLLCQISSGDKMHNRLEGRVAVITDGGHGIGMTVNISSNASIKGRITM